MTIEEKAKAYDEALKVLHKYDGANIMFSQSLKEEMFPELKESEDERISGAIIHFISHTPTVPKGIIGKEIMIAWLEKQGKNNMGISEATRQELEDNLNKALEKETPESCNEFLEKQGEQKEVAPKFRVGDTIRNIKYPSQVYKITKIDRWCYISGETEHTSIRILIIDQDKWELVEQKPVELQQDMLSQEQYAKAVDECIYGEQKPVAWSKEDENIIEWLIGYLEYQIMNTNILEEKKNCLDAISMLKSLRPQSTWKPSESDIRILEQVINGTVNPINYHATLYAILEQLKKLKE